MSRALAIVRSIVWPAPKRPAKRKAPTSTSIVEAAMIAADDFITSKQLQAITALDSNHVSAALHLFKKYSAADCLEEGGTLWWYLTPATDRRSFKIDERSPEARPRRTRRLALPKPPPSG